jgi:hypothetical protein
MKITESSSLAGLDVSGKISSPRPPRTQPGAASAPESELNISAASQAVFAGRPERIAELRNLVNSGAYEPQTAQVGQKMVDSALQRPE